MDDILLVLDDGFVSVADLSESLNNLDPDMNFKLESSGVEVNFLDNKITIKNSNVVTDIFYKPTYSKQYLNFHCHHPCDNKIALPYNLSRRICTIVSDEKIRMKRLLELKQCLIKCKCPIELIDDGIQKAYQ